MGAHRLADSRRERVPVYSVIGEYTSSGGDHFVRHVALLRADRDLQYGDDVEVWHMAPPLVAGEEGLRQARSGSTTCTAHVVGTMRLSADDRDGIQTWLAEVDKERRPQQPYRSYIVNPPVSWVVDEQTGTRRYRRFSCAGFVIESYREGAGISLLKWDSNTLPPVGLDIIERQYGNEIRQHGRLLLKWGIPGEGPWPVTFPGYLLHAMNRPDAEIRSSPHTTSTVDEAEFP